MKGTKTLCWWALPPNNQSPQAVRVASLILLVMFVPLTVACYPVRVLQQPKLKFEVREPSGKPIAGAVVHLARHPDSSRSFAGGPPVETSALTDKDGVLRFRATHDWQVAALLPDATATYYIWSWCIEKSSYMPSVTNLIRPAEVPDKVIVIELRPSQEAVGCSAATAGGYATRPSGVM